MYLRKEFRTLVQSPIFWIGTVGLAAYCIYLTLTADYLSADLRNLYQYSYNSINMFSLFVGLFVGILAAVLTAQRIDPAQSAVRQFRARLWLPVLIGVVLLTVFSFTKFLSAHLSYADEFSFAYQTYYAGMTYQQVRSYFVFSYVWHLVIGHFPMVFGWAALGLFGGAMLRKGWLAALVPVVYTVIAFGVWVPVRHFSVFLFPQSLWTNWVSNMAETTLWPDISQSIHVDMSNSGLPAPTLGNALIWLVFNAALVTVLLVAARRAFVKRAEKAIAEN